MPRLLSLILILAAFFVNDLSAQVLASRKKKSIPPAIEVTADTASHKLLFDLKNMAKDEYSIFVFNTEGRNVISTSMTNGYARSFEMGLSLSRLESSTYYYSIVNKRGAVIRIGKFDILDNGNTILNEDFGLKSNALAGSSEVGDMPYEEFDNSESIVPMIVRDIYNTRYFSMVIVQQSDDVPVGYDTSRQLTPGVYYVIGSGSRDLDVEKLVIR